MIRKLLLASGMAIMLSACGTTGGGTATTCSTPICVSEKLLTGAHDVHAAIATVADQLAVSGVLHGTQATQVKQLIDQSEAILTTADTAVAAGNATTVAQQVAEATTLVAQIQAIIGGMK
jgi:hypothetical protein